MAPTTAKREHSTKRGTLAATLAIVDIASSAIVWRAATMTAMALDASGMERNTATAVPSLQMTFIVT